MKKKFLSNLILLIILNLLIKPFWFFGIEVAVQNTVGEEMYGFYFSLFNFAFIMNILLDAGITNFNNRSISRDHGLLDSYISRIIPLKFLLSIVYGAVVFGAGALIGYSAIQFKLLLILVVNQFLSSFILYFRSNISGLQLFRTDSLLSVLDRSIMILMNGTLLWTGITGQQYKIEWFVYSQTASYIITLSFVMLILFRHTGRVSFEFNLKKIMSILKMSYPFAILILLMSFFNRADSVMIERLLPDGKFQAGIYAQSYRVLDALSQFAVLFAALLLPMFSKMLKSGESVTELSNMAFSLLMSASISVAVIGLFFNHDIILLMYKDVELNSELIFSLLMIGFIFICISYTYGTLLTANNNLKQLNILAFLTVILNVSLNFILIPRKGAVGASIASMSSQGFFAIGQILVAHKMIALRFETSLLLKILAFIVLASTGAFLLSEHLEWGPALILFIILALFLAVVLRLIKPIEMFRTLTED